MKATDIPASISTPFANGGTKNSIPVPSQTATDPGLASYTDGFPPATFTDIAAGGVPPYGADFNGILYALSALIRWQNSGGNFPYDASFSTAIGGYPKGATVSNATGDGFWLSTADDNTTDPSADTSGKWVPINNAGTATIALASSNVTLTPAQYEKRVLILTGSLTANVQLTFPKIAGTWTIENQTTGGYTVSALTSGGAVIALAPSGPSAIYCDGSNMLWQIPFATNAQSLAGTDANVAANPAGVAAFLQQYAITSPYSSNALGIKIESVDLNSYDFKYYVVHYWEGVYPSNGPAGVSAYGEIIVYPGNPGNREDMLFDRFNGVFYFRSWTSGLPNAWRKVWDSSNFTPADYLTIAAAAADYLTKTDAAADYLPLHDTADNAAKFGNQLPSFYLWANSQSYVRGATVSTPTWSASTTYTNSSGQPMMMSLWGHETVGANPGSIAIYVDGQVVAENGSYGSNTVVGVTALVPAGSTFEYTLNSVAIDGMRMTQ